MRPARREVLVWFGGGVAAGVALYGIERSLRPIVRPEWLQAIHVRAWWVPWIIVLVVAVLRWRRGTPIRFISYLAFAAGMAVLYIALVASLFLRPAMDQVRNSRPFDPAAWRAHAKTDDPGWPMRLRMANDLLASYELVGMSRDSIYVLLGPPDSASRWGTWDLVYHLGPERGLFGFDSEWLVLRYGPDARVTEAEVVLR